MLISSHVVVVVLIVGIVWIGYRSPAAATGPQVSSSILDPSTLNVDQVVAANVATTAAQLTNMPVYNNVSNLSVSLNAKTEMDQTDDTMLNKPQIIDPSGRDKVTTYVAQAGDTVQSVAAKFNISDDTVRWANNLTSDALTPGTTYKILGTTGILYTVKPGDSTASLANKYKADQALIVAFNDLELSGLNAGQQIIIPNGILPDTERPGYVAPQVYSTPSDSTGVRVAYYGGNGYAYGYCTYYAYNRRAEIGRPISGNWGNAATWAYYARQDGFRVDKTPEVGAVMQTSGGWGGYTYFGHVAVVERLNSDGSIIVSEMNATAGWGRVDDRTIPASEVALYNYIH